MKFYLLFIAFLMLLLPVSVLAGECGDKTSETPASASLTVYKLGGTLKSLRGRVLMPNGEGAFGAIVEIYRNTLSVPIEDISYVEADEILKSGRIEAKFTTNGKFCFKHLKAGNYMLRINTYGEFSIFATVHVFISIAPKFQASKAPKLEITFDRAP